jgi:hypothetical protein
MAFLISICIDVYIIVFKFNVMDEFKTMVCLIFNIFDLFLTYSVSNRFFNLSWVYRMYGIGK